MGDKFSREIFLLPVIIEFLIVLLTTVLEIYVCLFSLGEFIMSSLIFNFGFCFKSFILSIEVI